MSGFRLQDEPVQVVVLRDTRGGVVVFERPGHGPIVVSGVIGVSAPLPLAVASGGTGATDAAGARSNLSVPYINGGKGFEIVDSLPADPDPDAVYITTE